MTTSGALAANLHEGSRSEYLAQYLFASFGTAVPVPHQEDTGVDFYCTLTERVGRRAWPQFHYTVQVKSTMSPWTLRSRRSVRWLVEHKFPLFLCVLEKLKARLRLYHTFPRFLLWAFDQKPESLKLVPGEGDEGVATSWEGRDTISLGAPILDRTVVDFLKKTRVEEAKEVIKSWLKAEAYNLTLIH
jgi:hypothetical protein